MTKSGEEGQLALASPTPNYGRRVVRDWRLWLCDVTNMRDLLHIDVTADFDVLTDRRDRSCHRQV